MTKKSEAAELLAEFTALNVSYTVAAAELKLPRATVHAALHGTAGNAARHLPAIRAWLRGVFAEREQVAETELKQAVDAARAAAEREVVQA